jgi:choline monooxygenase
LFFRELGGLLDMDNYKTEVFPKYSIQSCGGGTKETSGVDFAGRVGKQVLYAWLYPNFMINRYGPIMDTNVRIFF